MLYEEVHWDNKGPFIIYAGGWADKNKGGGRGHANFRIVQGGHEEIGVQEGGSCLILQFCFISKKCVHRCRQY